MGNFDRNNKRPGGFNRGFGGNRPFGGRKRFEGREGRPAMHQATCSECGNSCEIPFKPSAGRAVFCSNCFAVKRGDGSSTDNRGSRPNNFSGERRERPSFQARETSGNNNSKEVVEQIKALNNKIDMLVKMLTPTREEETTKEKAENKKASIAKETINKKAKTKITSKKATSKKKK